MLLFVKDKILVSWYFLNKLSWTFSCKNFCFSLFNKYTLSHTDPKKHFVMKRCVSEIKNES